MLSVILNGFANLLLPCFPSPQHTTQAAISDEHINASTQCASLRLRVSWLAAICFGHGERIPLGFLRHRDLDCRGGNVRVGRTVPHPASRGRDKTARRVLPCTCQNATNQCVMRGVAFGFRT